MSAASCSRARDGKPLSLNRKHKPGIIGFTGTQHGMTPAQRLTVAGFFGNRKGSEFHHGDCIGADAEAHDIAIEAGCRIVIHPPDISDKRAFCAVREGLDFAYQPKPYLVRNHDIVDLVDEMLAAPGETEEQLRSGTWATVRYARKSGKKLFTVFPDGKWSYEPSRS
jgi:hypothetical protein